MGKSYIAILFGLGVRSASLAALVVVLARSFGAKEYGAYAAAASIATFLATFSGFGAAALHVRDVSRGSLGYRHSLYTSVVQICWSLPGLVVISAGLSWLLIPDVVPPISISMLVVGQLLAAASTVMLMRTCQARGRFFSMAAAMCGIPIIQLGVAVALIASIERLTFVTWSWISLATGAAAMAVLLFIGFHGGRSTRGASVRKDWRDCFSGLSFALSSASSLIHGDADKVILARMVGTSVAGEYAIAYRLTDVLTLPIVAGVERLLPTLFRRGEGGFLQAARAALRRGLLALGAALALSAGVYLIAPILPYLVGHGYQASVHIARTLALAPFTMTLWIIVRTLAATSNHEHAMGITEFGGAIFNIAAGVAAIALWGWIGAVYATYATHIIMTTALLLWVFLIERTKDNNCFVTAPSGQHKGRQS